MRIGIVAAMNPEMESLVDYMKDSEEIESIGTKFYIGRIENNEVIVVQSGVGKVNAALSALMLIKEFGCSLIINTGIAGGTAPLKHRDVILANSVSYHDFDATIFGYKYGQVPGLPYEFQPNINSLLLAKGALNKLGIEYKETKIYSGDQFVSSMDLLNKIDDNKGIAVEMEGAGVAQTCIKCGVDFIILRYISDIVGEENQNENYLEFELDMSKRSASICIKLISNLE